MAIFPTVQDNFDSEPFGESFNSFRREYKRKPALEF
jgi:hypothetical protein